MENMGINQLAQMFMGNPQPLAQKVQQAQQQAKPGRIPADLEAAIALQKIQEMRNAAGNQQAMQGAGPQPTVVDQLKQMMAPQGMPQGQPMQQQGMAQQPQQAPQTHGVDQLPSNLGQNYAGGGIIAFSGEGGSLVEAAKDIYNMTPEEVRDFAARKLRGDAAKETLKGVATGASEAGGATYLQGLKSLAGRVAMPLSMIAENLFGTSDEEMKTLREADARRVMQDMPESSIQGTTDTSGIDKLASGIAATQKPQQKSVIPAQSGIRQAAPIVQRQAPQAPAADPFFAKQMNQDPEVIARASQARMDTELGNPNTEAEKAMIAELQAKRAKAQSQADPLAEWARGVAGARPGQKWWQSGVAGSEYANRVAANRESADTEFLKEILGHQTKVNEAERAYKMGKFNLGETERNRIYKETFDAYKAQNASDDAAKRLAQEAVLRREEIAGANARAAMPGSEQKFLNDLEALRQKDPDAYAEKIKTLNAIKGNTQKQENFNESMALKRQALLEKNDAYKMIYNQWANSKDAGKRAELESRMKMIEDKELGKSPQQSNVVNPSGKVKFLGYE